MPSPDYDCGYIGLNKCETECAAGVLDDCVALARHCARLRADRPPSPDRPPSEGPRWEAAPLPASLDGCFKVVSPQPGKPPCVAADPVEGDGSNPESDYQPCPLDGAFDEGALFCFAKDRYFVKPTRAPWDVRPVEWRAAPNQRAFRAHQEEISVHTPSGALMGPHGAVDELRLRGQDVWVVGVGLAVRVARIMGPEGDVVRGEVAALPSLEQACRGAARCEAAIPGGLDLPPDSGLRSCAARAVAARAALVKQRGEGEAKRLCP